MAKTYDIAIVGGGLAGLTLGCLTAASGQHTAVLDQAGPAQKNDLRTTAISYGSRKILEAAGIWKNLSAAPCPIEEIKITDGDSPLLLDFLKEESDGKIFGWIVENSDLRNAMLKTLKSFSNAGHLAPVKVMDFDIRENDADVICKDRTITAKLIVGADGRNSFTRDWMDVPVREWKYKQRAIVCAAAHEYPHNNVAVENFHPQGPFAILPMADAADGTHRSSVVFTEHGGGESVMDLDDAGFTRALAERFPENYGRVALAGPRAAHPLSLIHAARYIAPRMALVADAAHAIHPVAGQGLNLGFRDIEALAGLVRGQADPGASDILENYERARRFDNTAMVAVTDGLVRLFSNNLRPVRYLRRTGLKLVAKLPAAKRFFIRQAMGDKG